MRGAGVKRKVDSHAVRVRTAWFFVIAKVAGVYEVHIGYRYWDQSVGLWSSAPSNDSVKPPWGAIKSCEFKADQRNAKGEVADYYQIGNERGDRRLFKASMMNPLVWGINDFTQKCAGMRVGSRIETLSVYLTRLLRVKGFANHEPDVHDDLGFNVENYERQVEELEEKNGMLAEYTEFVEYACVSAFEAVNRKAVSSRISTKTTSSADGAEGSEIKKSKKEILEAEKEDEVDDEDGIEKTFSNCYIGRVYLSIDKLSVSKQVFTKMNEYKVVGLAKSIFSRCDPSNLVMTVVPKNMENFDEDNMEDSDYEIINGRHRFEALKYLDRKNQLASLSGLEDRKVVCYVLKTSCAVHANYGSLRGNEIQASYVRKPHIHELVYIAEGLKKIYPMNQVEEALVRYCKILMIHPDEVTALKKIVQWPQHSFDHLVAVLKLFEAFETADVKGASSLDKTKAVPVVLFKQLGQVNPEYFSQHAEKVKKKECSLKDVIESFHKIKKREKVKKIICKEVAFQSVEDLEANYPGKFSDEVLDRYVGAEIEGKMKNKKGRDLLEYVEGVFRSDEEGNYSCVKKLLILSRVNGIMDIDLSSTSTAVFSLKGLSDEEGLAAFLLRWKKENPKISYLLLFNSESHQRAFLNYLLTEKYKNLYPSQIFFDAEADNASESDFNICQNLKFAILLNTNHIRNPPLKIYNGNLSNVKLVVEKVSSRESKIVFASEGSSPIIDLGSGFKEIVYYGDKKVIEKFDKDRDKTKGIFDEKVDDNSQPAEETVVVEKLNKNRNRADILVEEKNGSMEKELEMQGRQKKTESVKKVLSMEPVNVEKKHLDRSEDKIRDKESQDMFASCESYEDENRDKESKETFARCDKFQEPVTVHKKHLDRSKDENRDDESKDMLASCSTEQSLLFKSTGGKKVVRGPSESENGRVDKENRSPDMFESSSSTVQSLIFKSSRKLRCDFGAEMPKIEDNIEED